MVVTATVKLMMNLVSEEIQPPCSRQELFPLLYVSLADQWSNIN